VEFLAAIRKGLDQIERGQTVPHDEVKRQLARCFLQAACQPQEFEANCPA
jgi:predicted transcriptional regulator